MIRINLAPIETRKRRASFSIPVPSFNLGVLFGVLYVLAAATLAYAWWGVAAEETRLKADLDGKERELASYKITLGQGANVKDQLADLKKRVAVIEELMKGQSRPILMFDAFADVVPRDLWITSMEDKGATLKLSGSAFSSAAISDLMANLRASGKFKDVDIIVSKQDLAKSPSLITFEIACRYES
jgi:type IV pilus assembly protein PilN